MPVENPTLLDTLAEIVPRDDAAHAERFDLEAKILYSIAVAGKKATMIDKAIRVFLERISTGETPFTMVLRLEKDGYLLNALKASRIGNYGRLLKAYPQCAKSGLDLKTATPDDLEKIHGIGPKTSRFFILWTRENSPYAALDVHVLRWLNYIGFPAPRVTPSDRKKYAALEKTLLAEAKARGMSPRDLDAAVWDFGSQGYRGEWPEKLRPGYRPLTPIA